MAADHGHLHILEWLIEQNPMIFLDGSLDDTVRFAAVSGHLKVLQWLQQQPSLEV